MQGLGDLASRFPRLPQGAAGEPSKRSCQVRHPKALRGDGGRGFGSWGPESPPRATRTFPGPPAQGSLQEPDLAPPPAFAVAARGGPIGARDRGPRPARGREERGGRRERAHTPPPPPEPARGARGQGGADRPSHSPGLRAGTRCRRRRVRPSPPALGARGEKVTASWPAGRRTQGERGSGQGDRGAETSWQPLGSWDRGGGGDQPAKVAPVPRDRPGAPAAGTARGRSKFSVVSPWSRRVEGGRELEGKAGCGRRGRAEGSLRSFLPWERKGRNGEGAMCRNVGPLGEAGGESGKWGGPLGRWSRHPAPSPTAAFLAGAAGEVIPSGSPRAKAAGCPFPAERRPSSILTPCLPEGMFSGQNLSGTSHPYRPRDCSVLAKPSETHEV
ncbi:unnamed protein product [Rangifer tarandus platyrhynchus]|uniref:Collagen alpha-1(I) chain-like n=1 Tax=Rangifer tarandus platyrhynchus TaxID=3082113 RepID=A0ABN8YWP6_RANTA|nr:unnamed protein product [Rangifer tarandus platyrhynchus]